MIIDFAVSNYRSIREEVVLSAVAQQGRKSESNGSRRIWSDEQIASPLMIAGRNIGTLPCLCIFGANASGKSNVLMALDHLLRLVTNEHLQTDQTPQAVVPFKLDIKPLSLTTRFELRVAVDQHFTTNIMSASPITLLASRNMLDAHIYTYVLKVNSGRIEEESLNYLPAGGRTSQKLFLRTREAGPIVDIWRPGSVRDSSPTKIKPLMRDDEPFLSKSELRAHLSMVEPLLDWLGFRWPGIGLGHEESDRSFAIKFVKHVPHYLLPRVTTIIRQFDTGIQDIEIPDIEDRVVGSDVMSRIYVTHRVGDVMVRWSLDQESTGTQRLFDLAARMFWSFEGGVPMIVDELGSHIHPHITRTIVSMFQNPKTNPKRAQLIFTSHDSTLQHGHLLRRDQIWFTEKRPDGSTNLYPLTDFHVRNDLAIDRAYMDGRFGAVPILPSEDELVAAQASVG